MNWEAIGTLAEVIGAIGVILSLLYVGRELKQANSMARSATRQEISAGINNWSLSIASSPALTDDMADVQYHDLIRDDASDAQRMRIGYTFFSLINQQRYAYQQWKEGIISEDELNEILGPGAANALTAPYLRSVWPILRLNFPKEFAAWYTKRYELQD